MEKGNNIVKWLVIIAKIIYLTVLVLFGLWLVYLVITLFIPHKIYDPFERFDWNPIATFVGALLTAIATFCAVFLTSWQDRKARKFEYNYKYVQEKLTKYYELLESLADYNLRYFSKDKREYIKIPLVDMPMQSSLIDLLNISIQLQYYNLSIKDSLMKFEPIIKNFISIQKYLDDAILSEHSSIQRNGLVYTVNLQEFFKYISETHSDIDLSDKSYDIFEMKELILTQFKLED